VERRISDEYSKCIVKLFRDYQRSNLRPNTAINYRYMLENFEEFFGERELRTISSEELFHFLELLTEDTTKATKNHR
jgi:site-specific recombinase XerD